MPVAWARATAAGWGCLLRTMTMQDAPVMSAVRTTWALVSPVSSAKRSWSKASTSLSRSLAATESTGRPSWSAQQIVSPARILTTSATVIMGMLDAFSLKRRPESGQPARVRGGGGNQREGGGRPARNVLRISCVALLGMCWEDGSLPARTATWPRRPQGGSIRAISRALTSLATGPGKPSTNLRKTSRYGALKTHHT